MNQREKFEEWHRDYTSGKCDLEQDENGNYVDPLAIWQWRAWQAAQTESAKEIEQLRERLKVCGELIAMLGSGHYVPLVYEELFQAAREACKGE